MIALGSWLGLIVGAVAIPPIIEANPVEPQSAYIGVTHADVGRRGGSRLHLRQFDS